MAANRKTGFKINEQGLQQVLQDATKNAIQKAQPEFDALSAECAGQPEADVRAKLEAVTAKWGLKLDEPTIANLTATLCSGEHIQLR